MKLKEIIDRLELKVAAAGENLDREVAGGYASDLLSDVMANSREGDIWVTLQAHPNIIAVASLKGWPASLLCRAEPPRHKRWKRPGRKTSPLWSASCRPLSSSAGYTASAFPE